LEYAGIDPLARSGNRREPRNRLAAPRDFDRLARLDPIDKFAQLGLGIR
jgi:hypothetical protein